MMNHLHAHPSTPPVSPLMDSADSAAYIKVNPRTLANWRVLGKGPRYTRVGRRPFYRIVDLETWLAAREFANRVAELAAGSRR